MKAGARRAAMLARLRSRQLAAWATLVLVTIGIVQVGASLLFYAAIDRQTLREDHARRVAELLVVSSRVHQLNPAATATVMSTGHLNVRLASTPSVAESGGTSPGADAIAEIRKSILIWEPSLRTRTLRIEMREGRQGRRDLVGSMLLDTEDRRERWLNFRASDILSSWPIALRATTITLVVTLLCIGAGLGALRFLTMPLRALSDAADAIRSGGTVAVAESDPADLRTLARSMNDMQARISGLISDQAKSFEAISHDLRTPLTRMKIAADFVADSEIARLVASSADEMEALLMSLQQYLRAQHLTAEPENLDLTAAVRGMLDGLNRDVRLSAPEVVIIRTWREPLLLALKPLVENALHHGTHVDVIIAPQQDGAWSVTITDDGPGIPDVYFDRLLDPFFRLDAERARDTDGFGLGIPTAHRLLQRFGGALSFANAPDGGLVVRVVVPTSGEIERPE